MTTTSSQDVLDEIKNHLRLREGVRTKVYKDSLGKLTVGVGHLVLPKDNLALGDEISQERVYSFLEQDLQASLKAAEGQMTSIGVNYQTLFKALVHVNFQLGTAWNKTHKNTWKLLLNHKFAEASEEIKDSLWYSQTPVRVNDFSDALMKVHLLHVANRSTL